MIEVRRVGSERRDQLVATLAAAFADDPFIGWVLAESPYEPREAQLRWWSGALRAMAGVAVLHATQDSSAVAVWVPPHDPDEASAAGDDSHSDSSREANAEGDDGAEFVNLLNDVCGAGAEERLAFFARLYGAARPEPHWHLTAVGVAPDSQGQGWGSRVIAPQLAQCDRLGRPAYLEATTSRSRRLYERLGFEAFAEMAPADGPDLVLMWREPR